MKPGRPQIVLIAGIAILTAGTISYAIYFSSPASQQPENTARQADASSKTHAPKQETPPRPQPIKGKRISIGDAFSVTVPAGWKASVSSDQSFLGVQFGRPGQIHSLTYNRAKVPSIDHGGIPSWSGLTEHYYIRAITANSQAFRPHDHQQVSSKLFAFDDGTKGKKYSVTKRAAEAERWGGLQKDDRWYGRVYRYEKAGHVIEAHLAYYPSTSIDTAFFERVAKTISRKL